MTTSRRRPYDAVKRGLDLVGGCLFLVISLPLQLIVAVLVRVRMGSPVLFRQERPGRDGRVFTLLKFRTMDSIDQSLGFVTDAERLTVFGKWLRSTSLDELPTLLNVVKGDMSFVGPRPLLVRYLERYSPRQARRHEVRPGITGLAQVSGRNAIDWGTKLALDVQYVDSRSFASDARILWRTVAVVLTHRGVSAQGQATANEFTGSADKGVVG